MLCGAAPDLVVTGMAQWPRGQFSAEAPDIVVFNIGSADLGDPQVVNAFDTVRAGMPDVPVILLSERDDTATALSAIRAGYRGYVQTTLTGSMLLAAIRLVLAGGTFVAPAIVQDYAERSAEDRAFAANGIAACGLTRREVEVLNCLRHGKPNKVIAYELNVSTSTVKIYVRNIMKKVKATNRTQVAFLVERLMSIAADQTGSDISSAGGLCRSGLEGD
jgi:DNA-binding NarL/FixJ family response regulator